MRKNIKKYATICSIISLFLLVSISMTSSLAITKELDSNYKILTSDISVSDEEIQFSWSEDTLEFWMNETYEGDSQIQNVSGSYSDSYTYTHSYEGYYNSTYDDVWIEKETICQFTETYSQTQNFTIIGNLSNHLLLDVYRVDVKYGDNLNLTWVALKNGTQIGEQKIYNYSIKLVYEQNYTRDYIYKTKIYNKTTNELLDTIIDNPDPVTGNYSGESYIPDLFSDGDNWTKVEGEAKFSMPIILSMQFFNSQNDTKVALADLIQGQYYIYNDTDNDGIYSIGENETLTTFDMCENAEFQGIMTPYVGYLNINTSTGNSTHSSPSQFFNIPLTEMPTDISVSDILGNISFTKPQKIGDIISWDIEYSEYPIAAAVADKPGKGMYGVLLYDRRYYTFLTNMPANIPKYEKCSPGNFSYGFDYFINQNEANLDYSLGISKLSNNSFYDAVQGLGLSLPHYTYFISSETINQTANNAITRPEDLFGFEIGDSLIAQLDMSNPLKKNYTLYDYPETGNKTELESFGGTVNQLVTSSESQKVSAVIGAGDYSAITYALENEIEGDPAFENFTGLYTMATQNYLVWSGEKLEHDPTFTVYFKESTSPSWIPFIPSQESNQINWYLVIPLFATIVITVSVIAIKIKRKRER